VSFELHYSLAHAIQVLRLVRRKVRGTPFEITVDCWANGREQGFHLHRYSRKSAAPEVTLVIAQQRNSDSVLVIHGEPRDFDIQTNHPKQKLWNTSGNLRMFNGDEEAASYIADLLAYYPMKELAKDHV